MRSSLEHYERHLGPIYTWMGGDFEVAVERSREELRGLGLGPEQGGTVIDLGAGSGGYAVPLARWGYDTVALDTCTPLVTELRERAEGLPLRVIQNDLLSFRQYCERATAILCMGDTLTHLPTREAVSQLLSDAAAALDSPGLFCATFRDYHTREMEGLARFIPVRSDERRILTCFLEYEAEQVTVYDLLQERGDGGWQLSVSSYPKLRLDPAWVVGELRAQGLSVQQDRTDNGMIRVVGRR